LPAVEGTSAAKQIISDFASRAVADRFYSVASSKGGYSCEIARSVGCGRVPFTNVRIVIRAGLRPIHRRWRKGQSRPSKRKSVKNRGYFEEAVGFPTLPLLHLCCLVTGNGASDLYLPNRNVVAHRRRAFRTPGNVNLGSMSDSRTSSCHRPPEIAIRWLHR
jgi:hypothetical protein